jgi:nitrogen fixation/metabolism regulation signal transduction histidine kinase
MAGGVNKRRRPTRLDGSTHRPRHPHFEHRILVVASIGAAPFALLAVAFMLGFDPTGPAAMAWFVVAVLFWWLTLGQLRRTVSFPLRTVATLLEALREGDYLLRGRMDVPGDALGEVIREVNELRDTLSDYRQRAEETVALLRKVIESVDMAVFTFGAEGGLRLANAAGRQLLAIEARGRSDLEALDADSLGLADLLDRTGPAVMEREFPGGQGRWEIRHRSFREGGDTHHLLVISDLSRLLREEERSAWQRLIRVLGHEINNSLAPIQTITDALERRLDAGGAVAPELEEDLRDGLGLIGSRAASLERFIQGYTLLARLPEPERRPVDIAALVDRVVRFEGLQTVACEGPELIVDADPAQLEQALINLVRNAVEAVNGEGEVRVSWQRRRSNAVIQVDDRGPGLPDSDNLFVPFFTTKPEGNGIGLVLCRRIAEAHGGRLNMGNRKNGGCRATISLPMPRQIDARRASDG